MADEQRGLRDAVEGLGAELDALTKRVNELGARAKRDQVADLVDRVNELGVRLTAVENALGEIGRTLRIEGALKRIGAEFLPPNGWEERVLEATSPPLVAARRRGPCSCTETWPQLTPGKVSHGPGCPERERRDTIPGAPPAPPPAPADDDDHVDDSAGTSWSEPD